MKTMMKLLPVIILLLVAFTAIPQVNAQGIKIGYVDDQRIVQEYKAFQKAQQEWDLEQKAWEEEAQTKQIEIQELLDEYDKQKLILSDEKKKEKEATIRTKQEALDAYTRQVFGPGGTAERKQQQLLVPLQDNVTKAIEAVAIEGNYDVIFTVTSSGLGYIKEIYDITEKVLAQLDNIEQ